MGAKTKTKGREIMATSRALARAAADRQIVEARDRRRDAAEALRAAADSIDRGADVDDTAAHILDGVSALYEARGHELAAYDLGEIGAPAAFGPPNRSRKRAR